MLAQNRFFGKFSDITRKEQKHRYVKKNCLDREKSVETSFFYWSELLSVHTTIINKSALWDDWLVLVSRGRGLRTHKSIEVCMIFVVTTNAKALWKRWCSRVENTKVLIARCIIELTVDCFSLSTKDTATVLRFAVYFFPFTTSLVSF